MRWTATIAIDGAKDVVWNLTDDGSGITVGTTTYDPGIFRVQPWRTTVCNVGQTPRAKITVSDSRDQLTSQIREAPVKTVSVTAGVTFLVNGAWIAVQPVMAGIIVQAVPTARHVRRASELTIVPKILAAATNPAFLSPRSVSGTGLAKNNLQTKTKWVD